MRRGFAGEVHAEVFIGQLGLGEGVLALDVAEVGGGMGPECFAIGEQEVEGAVRCDLGGQLAQGVGQLFDAGNAGVGFPQLLHDPAEGLFAVGVAYGLEVGV